MQCQKCGNKDATTYVKILVNGKLCEYALCIDCAGSYGAFLPCFDSSSFFKGVFPETVPVQTKCPLCGASFSEIVSTGKVGCWSCYDFFYDKLLPSIQRIHGTAENRGKTPGKAAMMVMPAQQQALSTQTPLQRKRTQLHRAVLEQRFEDAAVLRDQIKAMEQGGDKK